MFVRPLQVGVVGVGGLGHLALQFANAMGATVVAFTSTPAKAAEAASFGAHSAVMYNVSVCVCRNSGGGIALS